MTGRESQATTDRMYNRFIDYIAKQPVPYKLPDYDKELREHDIFVMNGYSPESTCRSCGNWLYPKITPHSNNPEQYYLTGECRSWQCNLTHNDDLAFITLLLSIAVPVFIACLFVM